MNDESPDADGTERVASPRPWMIELTAEDPLASGGEAPAMTLGMTQTPIEAVVMWAKNDGTGYSSLYFARFGSHGWSRAFVIGSDTSGQLDPSWWANSGLFFVQGTPGDTNPHVSGTPGSVDPENTIPVASIDTGNSETDPARIPAHAWTIYIDNSILVLPSTAQNRDGEPTLGVTRMGDTVVPTVTWAHAVGAGNHDPVIVRFVNGAWTPAEVITASLTDDVDPRIAQDPAQTVHAVWARKSEESAVGSAVMYSNLMNGVGAFSVEEAVTRRHEAVDSPTVAALPSGEVFVAYQSEPDHGSPRIVLARRVEREHGREGFTYRYHVAGRASGDTPASPELSTLVDGSLLLTWVASPERVGFRLYAHGKWSAAAYEPIGASESASEVRDRLRVVGSRADTQEREQHGQVSGTR